MYVHVPFCKSICYYCDFTHMVYREDMVEEWLNALQKELQHKDIHAQVSTVYIGGGTPTCLSSDQLERLLSLLDVYTTNAEEYTIEVNPETLDEEKVKILQTHGINRVSMGLQTSNTRLLQQLGRKHTYTTVQQAIQMLHNARIDNISLDIMYSLPDQTLEDLQKTVKDAIALQPKHLSLYSLTIEENTVFGKTGVEALDEDREADMYEWICQYLPSHGFRQYEVSNFCQEGYASKHNLGYWYYDDFYGISCGASGKEGNCRYDNTKSLMAYLKDPCAKETVVLSLEDREFEMVMMSLRLKQGMDFERYAQMFQEDFSVRFGEVSNKLIQKGWLKKEGSHLKCTEESYPILNSVLVEMMEGENTCQEE